MPTKYTGAEIEPTEIPTWALFEIERSLKKEREDRGWNYLRKLGHEMYRQISMSVQLIKRGKVDIILMNVEYENNFATQALILEVPLLHFNSVLSNGLV